MSDEKRELIIKELIELCQSGVDFDKAFRKSREKYGVE